MPARRPLTLPYVWQAFWSFSSVVGREIADTSVPRYASLGLGHGGRICPPSVLKSRAKISARVPKVGV